MKNIKIQQLLEDKHKKTDIIEFFDDKITKFQNMIQNTILMAQKYKTLNIYGARELNICIQGLDNLFQDLKNVKLMISKKLIDKEDILNRLQMVNNELSQLFRSFGTKDIIDVINVCFGINYTLDTNYTDKYSLIKSFVHPISYKVMEWKAKKNVSHKKLAKNRIVEDFMIVEIAESLNCFDLARTSKNFQTKVYGIKVAFQNPSQKKTLIISGIVDDISLQCLSDPFLHNKLLSLQSSKPSDKEFQTENFDKFLNILTIKELLVYSNDELYQRYIGYINQTRLIKQKPISQVIKEFINGNLYSQRTTIIQLLMYNNNPEFQYLAYLLYDILSNDNNGTIDTIEQTILFDSLPWQIKKHFREAMKTTINYTKNLSDFNSSKIPIEQQICLLKAEDTVKEKAMIKLKEVKAKSEDSGTKARQYLEGLLKIPFGIYREEPILSLMRDLRLSFNNLLENLKKEKYNINIKQKKCFTGAEIIQCITDLETKYSSSKKTKEIEEITKFFTSGNRNKLVANVCFINTLIKKHSILKTHICHSGKKNSYMKERISDFINKHCSNIHLIKDLAAKVHKKTDIKCYKIITKEIKNIKKKREKISENMKKIEDILESAVHGHKNAKRQIERIIGQWINGEQTGYCFGFEGPPGIGKTSLAQKGLSMCLKGKNGKTRPFAFIAIGGSCNGSTLNGHNYTYVGSTWGRIVDILIENKCMNPIIFIDELDKVSRTEHGKDIIAILTHLTDPAQNKGFQDKYFSGIDLDLSKALIIFSYNDPYTIDPILLDRIHRIRFKELTLEEKQVIVKKFILPELLKKMGLEGTVRFPKETIHCIIEKYTREAGVRKLKEKLFEIISEINLEILKQEKEHLDWPIVITKQDIKYKYLKDKNETRYKYIHKEPKVGLMNGLWANTLGLGGIIPIEAHWFPAGKFLELKLTGLQGDVMKESMNVAQTLAWHLTTKATQKKIFAHFKKNALEGGIHIHCPEGATPKDGPSAGAAITVTLYSLLNKKKIKNNIAITGEINLQGEITAIGGLCVKILGGIRGGIKEFIYPEENTKLFSEFMSKYKDNKCLEGITFHKVNNIKQVLKLVFV